MLFINGLKPLALVLASKNTPNDKTVINLKIRITSPFVWFNYNYYEKMM